MLFTTLFDHHFGYRAIELMPFSVEYITIYSYQAMRTRSPSLLEISRLDLNKVSVYIMVVNVFHLNNKKSITHLAHLRHFDWQNCWAPFVKFVSPC